MMKFAIYMSCLFCLFQTAKAQVSGQFNNDDAYTAWPAILKMESDNENAGFIKIINLISSYDTPAITKAVAELEKVSNKNHYYKARLYLLKALKHYKINYPRGKEGVQAFFEKALKESIETLDDNLVSFTSFAFGGYMFLYQDIEQAVTYCQRAFEINPAFLDQANRAGFASQAGEIFFHGREYKNSIHYNRISIEARQDTSLMSRYISMKLWNTMGQGYQQLKSYDSAIICYNQSLHLSKQLSDLVWEGINSGFLGQVYFRQKDFAKAKTLLAHDYDINKNYEFNIAGFTLQWLARINLEEGKKDSALLKAKESLRLLTSNTEAHIQRLNYLQYAYYTLADAYRSVNNTDSFYRYIQLYTSLHDSLERVAVFSSMEIARMRSANERNYQAMHLLQKEKDAELMKRNFIIAAIILMSIIVFLYVNHLRLKHRHKEQLAYEQKNRAEAETDKARAEMKLFTQRITENTVIIENLQSRILKHNNTLEQQHLVEELYNQTILTEEDWERFKIIFEKIHPLFFAKLKTQTPDITVAELRMAALTRLQLSRKQMAAMLGISVDSVHKTRQRLRQRLQQESDTTLEEFIAQV